MMRGWMALLLAAGGAALLAAGEGQAGERWSVSLGGVPVKATERVVGFEVQVRSARVVSLAGLPDGWEVSVENGPAGGARVSGSIIWGAAAFEAGRFDGLRDPAVVESRSRSRGGPVEVDAAILVTEDFETTRAVPLPRRDVTVNRLRR
jgi:hypothetical protein